MALSRVSSAERLPSSPFVAAADDDAAGAVARRGTPSSQLGASASRASVDKGPRLQSSVPLSLPAELPSLIDRLSEEGVSPQVSQLSLQLASLMPLIEGSKKQLNEVRAQLQSIHEEITVKNLHQAMFKNMLAQVNVNGLSVNMPIEVFAQQGDAEGRHEKPGAPLLNGLLGYLENRKFNLLNMNKWAAAAGFDVLKGLSAENRQVCTAVVSAKHGGASLREAIGHDFLRRNAGFLGVHEELCDPRKLESTRYGFVSPFNKPSDVMAAYPVSPPLLQDMRAAVESLQKQMDSLREQQSQLQQEEKVLSAEWDTNSLIYEATSHQRYKALAKTVDRMHAEFSKAHLEAPVQQMLDETSAQLRAAQLGAAAGHHPEGGPSRSEHQ
jgi:hypothetical protein